MAIFIPRTSMTMIEGGASIATSYTNDGQGNVAMKIFITIVLLVITSMAAKGWFYPFVIEDPEREIQFIFKVLQDNTTLEFDLLGDCAWKFRASLDVEYRRTLAIKDRSMVEPARWNFAAWALLRWREMRDVKGCYLSLMALKKEILTEVDERKRLRTQGPVGVRKTSPQ